MLVQPGAAAHPPGNPERGGSMVPQAVDVVEWQGKDGQGGIMPEFSRRARHVAGDAAVQNAEAVRPSRFRGDPERISPNPEPDGGGVSADGEHHAEGPSQINNAGIREDMHFASEGWLCHPGNLE